MRRNFNNVSKSIGSLINITIKATNQKAKNSNNNLYNTKRQKLHIGMSENEMLLVIGKKYNKTPVNDTIKYEYIIDKNKKIIIWCKDGFVVNFN